MIRVEPLTVGPIVGFTTDTRTRLWGRGPDKAPPDQRIFGVARIARAGDGAVLAQRSFKMMARYDYTGVCDLAPLAPETAYQYQVGFVRGGVDWEDVPAGADLDWSFASNGAMRTAPPPGQPRPLSLVFGSCRYLLLKWILQIGDESGDKAFRSVLEQLEGGTATDCLLMIGDQIYADDLKGIDPDDHLDEYLHRYRVAFSQPYIRRLMSRVPTYMTLDDHEIKDAWTMDMKPGREALYAAALTAYQSYQVIHGPAFDPSVPDDISATPTRYWYDFASGPARFFVLDTRNERYLSLSDGTKQIVSPTQLSALEQWLVAAPAESVKFVASSVPVFPDDRTEVVDKWSGFPAQRQHLLETIRSRGVKKVVFLSGDVHCSGWAELRCPGDPSFRAYSVISSPFFFPGPRLGLADRFVMDGRIPSVPHEFAIGASAPMVGDDAFTRLSVDAAATTMRVDLYDRKGALLRSNPLPL